MAIRTVPAPNGIAWLTGAFALVLRNPVFLLMGLFLAVLGAMPLLGPLVLSILNPALHGGIAFAVRERLAGREAHFRHLFQAFDATAGRIGPLLLLCLPNVLLGILLLLGFGMLLTQALSETASGAELPPPQVLLEQILQQHSGALAMLGGVALVLGILSFALTFFAVPLLMFSRRRALNAMLESLHACRSNLAAMALYLLTLMLFLLPLLLLIQHTRLLPLQILLVALLVPCMAVSACLAWSEVFQTTPQADEDVPPPDGGGLVA